jgi:uncharacterized SAM-binding protein YcdF (DUF218 family)
MFLLKKIVAQLLLPPGIFIFALLGSGLWMFSRKQAKWGFTNITLGIALWIISAIPVQDALMRGLDSGLALPSNPSGDVIILLGGGVYSQVTDISGEGAPSEDMLARIVAAVRLQKKLKVPIIISTGQVFTWTTSEAPIDKRFLIDLGVPPSKILLEEKSRDTIENARYSKEVCLRHGFTKPLLITSSLHMKRALLSFKKAGLAVTPFPAYLNKGKRTQYNWMEYLPGNPSQALFSLHEYLGLFFYTLAY